MAIFSNLIEKITNRRRVSLLEAALHAEEIAHQLTKAKLSQCETAVQRAVNKWKAALAERQAIFEQEKIAKLELEQERHDHALTKNGMMRTKSRQILTPVEQLIQSAEANKKTTRYFDEDVDWRLHTAHIAKLKRQKKRFRHIEAKLHARESELLRMGFVAPQK